MIDYLFLKIISYSPQEISSCKFNDFIKKFLFLILLYFYSMLWCSYHYIHWGLLFESFLYPTSWFILPIYNFFLKLSLLFHSFSLHLTIYLSCLFLFYIIISQNRNTPLLLAIAIGLTNVAIVLIEKHAYIDAKDRVSATFCTESFSWKFYPSMSQWILSVYLSFCLPACLYVYLSISLYLSLHPYFTDSFRAYS